MAASPSWLFEALLVAALAAGFVGAAVLAVVEVSLLRVRKSRVRVEAAQGDRRSQILLELLDDLPLVLNTVLFVVLICQVGVASISGYLAQRWGGGVWVTVASIVVSLLLFVYAESIPKTVAVRSPHERALGAGRGLRLLVRICRPVVAALVAFAGVHSPGQVGAADVVSEHELRLLARQAAQAGEIEAADAELVDRSFVFGDRQVGDVMVGRDEVVAVMADAQVDEALRVAIAAGHGRVPVLGRDINDVVGMVRLRDLAAASGGEPVDVASLMRRPLFCQSDESIAELLERMRASGTWLAVVHNAAFETVGLATVEDIIAELIGEIEEDPVVRPTWRRH